MRGEAKITLGSETFVVTENNYHFIPTNVEHRVQNTSDCDLEIIEVR